jgi:hypothetical protein
MKVLPMLLCVAAVALGAPAALKFDLSKFAREAEFVAVYSLFPSDAAVEDWHGNRAGRFKDAEHFHGFPVLGKVESLAREEHKDLRSALVTTLKPVTGDRAPSMCFTPRHGLCMTKGDEHVDLVLCFECEEARVYIYSGGHREKLEIAIRAGALEALNATFDRRGIQRDVPKKKR